MKLGLLCALLLSVSSVSCSKEHEQGSTVETPPKEQQPKGGNRRCHRLWPQPSYAGWDVRELPSEECTAVDLHQADGSGRFVVSTCPTSSSGYTPIERQEAAPKEDIRFMAAEEAVVSIRVSSGAGPLSGELHVERVTDDGLSAVMVTKFHDASRLQLRQILRAQIASPVERVPGGPPWEGHGTRCDAVGFREDLDFLRFLVADW